MGGTKVHNGSYSGWTRSVYTLSLPTLLSALNGGDKIEKQMWSKIPKVKFIRASPLFFNGSLLAVGGVDTSRHYMYSEPLYLCTDSIASSGRGSQIYLSQELTALV